MGFLKRVFKFVWAHPLWSLFACILALLVFFVFDFERFSAFAIGVYSGEIDFWAWADMRDKSLYNYIEIILVPATLAVWGITASSRNQKAALALSEQTEKIAKQERDQKDKLARDEREAQSRAEVERLSRAQFDDFLSYYLEISKESSGFLSEQQKHVTLFKSKLMFKTLTPFWLGEFIDFVGMSGISRKVVGIFNEARFSDVNIEGAKLENVEIQDIVFDRCKMRRMGFNKVTIKSGQNDENRSKFNDCNLKNAQLNGFEARSISFIKCEMIGLQSTGAIFTGCTIESCDLTNAQLVDAPLNSTHFTDCNLKSVAMQSSGQRNCSYTDSKFIGAKLQAAIFEICKFVDCEFESVKFANTGPNGLVIKGSGTKFALAIFENCHFKAADFTGIEKLSATFTNCTFDDDCVLLEGMRREVAEFTIDHNPNMSLDINAAKEKLSAKSSSAVERRPRESASITKKADVTETPLVIPMTNEARALAHIRKLGLQYKNEKEQSAIIKSLFHYFNSAPMSGEIRPKIYDAVEADLGLSRSSIAGVFKILTRAGCISEIATGADPESDANDEFSFGVEALDETSAGQRKTFFTKLSTSDTLDDWMEAHNAFMSEIFGQFGAKFPPDRADAPEAAPAQA